MFVTINAASSAIKSLAVSPANNQAVVEFTNGKSYIYNNVSEDSILDVIYGEIKSLGKFVNACCKGNNVLALNWYNKGLTPLSNSFKLFILC